MTVAGRVAEWRWTQPHTWVVLTTPRPGGGEDRWELEGPPLSWAQQRNWSATTLRAGESVQVVVYPARSEPHGGLIKRIVRANGETPSGQPPLARPPRARALTRRMYHGRVWGLEPHGSRWRRRSLLPSRHRSRRTTRSRRSTTSDKRTTLSAVVKQWRFVNPHPSIVVEVATPGAPARTWTFEMDNRWELAELGFTESTLKPGDRSR